MKYIFITGGVVSGLGKGICAASLGRLLKQRGLRVQNQKFDPYLNVDPGTMSPYQHGEVFVTDDGAETDLDLGHYERFTDESLTGGLLRLGGQGLLERSVPRARGRLSGPHRADHPAYHGRDQVPHLPDGQRNIRRAHHRDRRHGRRYRVTAVPRGHPAGGCRAGASRNVLFIHVPMIVEIPGSRRAQEQAHTALRQGAAVHRHPAGYPRLPHEPAHDGGHLPQNRPVLQHGAGLRHSEHDGLDAL